MLRLPLYLSSLSRSLSRSRSRLLSRSLSMDLLEKIHPKINISWQMEFIGDISIVDSFTPTFGSYPEIDHVICRAIYPVTCPAICLCPWNDLCPYEG